MGATWKERRVKKKQQFNNNTTHNFAPSHPLCSLVYSIFSAAAAAAAAAAAVSVSATSSERQQDFFDVF
jgi:hypothetical protein